MGGRKSSGSALLWARRAIGQRRIGRRYRLKGGFERIYLHHVRKTGGTSLSESFLELGGEDPLAVKRRMREGWGMARSGEFVFAAHARRALEEGRYFFGWSHIPAWDIELPEKTLSVTVLRDPVARAVSLYRYLADPSSDEGQPFPAPPAQRELAADGFDRFLERLTEPDLLAQLQMFSPSRDPAEAAERIHDCSFFFLLEHMDNGLGTLSMFAGHTLARNHERRSSQELLVSERQRASLREALAPEYELMGLLNY